LKKLKELGIWPQYPLPDFLIRVVIALLGFFLIAIANVMTLNANLGVRPDNSLYVGISNHTGITVGQASQIFTCAIIIINLFFRIYPAIGTLMDMYFVGFFMDIIMAGEWIPVPETMVMRVVVIFASIPFLALGIGLYMGVKIGEGPRDGLMLVLNQKYGWKIGTVRNTIEVILLVFALILGGPIGIGTVILAVVPGTFVERALKACSYPFKKENMIALITNRLPGEEAKKKGAKKQ